MASQNMNIDIGDQPFNFSLGVEQENFDVSDFGDAEPEECPSAPLGLSINDRVASFVLDAKQEHKPAAESVDDVRKIKKALASIASQGIEQDADMSARFHELQTDINPNMANFDLENVENDNREASKKVAARALLELISEAQEERSSWSDQRKCHDKDPSFFHPTSENREVQKKRPKVDELIEKAVEFCSDCPVIKQCESYGDKYNQVHAGEPRVYGGKAYGFNLRKRNQYRIAG